MSAFSDWIRSRCPHIVLAGLFLALGEVLWLLIDGRAIDLPRLGILTASSVTVVLVAVVTLEMLYCGAHRLSARWAPLLVSLAFVPLVVSATVSLFSGETAQRMPGAIYLAVGFGFVLLALVSGITVLAPQLRRTTSRRARTAWVSAFLAAMVGLSYIDSHVLLGLYPAFHYLALAGTLGAASLAARLCRPPSAQSRTAGNVAAGMAVAAALVCGLTWHTPDASYLAIYSHGILPKLRTASSHFSAAPRRSPPGSGSTPAERPSQADLRLSPTVHPELTAIRTQVRNVVFVVADALRADHVSKVVEGTSLTPHFDALKKEAIDFANAYSPGAFTGQAIPPLMSSFDVPVVDALAEFGVPLTGWIEHLTPAGYRSFANGLCDHVARSAMFRIDVATCFGAQAVGSLNGRSDDLVAEVLKFAEHQDSPFAVYTHWLDAHVPYKKIETYPAMVRRVDDRLGELMGGLQTAGLWDSTLLVVTADHGYFLGEGNRRANGGCCSDIQMRVPLIVRLPGSRFTSQRIETLVTTAQVPVAIVDLLAAGRRPPVGAESLLRTLYASTNSPPAAVYAGNDVKGMLRSGSHKLFWDTERSVSLVYDLSSDPMEQSPVVAAPIARDLRTKLSRTRQRHTEQSVFLLEKARTGIPKSVLIWALAERVDLTVLADLMDRFWSYDRETRLYLLETIFVRDLKDIRPALERVVRLPDEPDDQLLDVMLALVGAPGACEELASKLRVLEPRAKRLLGEIILGLSDACLATLRESLQEEIERAHETNPSLDSDEGRFVTLATYGLAQRNGVDLSRSMKVVLRDVHNQYARAKTSMTTLRDSYFDSGDLMLALNAATTLEDLTMLETLTITAHSSRHIYEKCRGSRDERCEAILLRIAREGRGADIAYIASDLEDRPASDWAVEFRATAHSRFPELFPNP